MAGICAFGLLSGCRMGGEHQQKSDEGIVANADSVASKDQPQKKGESIFTGVKNFSKSIGSVFLFNEKEKINRVPNKVKGHLFSYHSKYLSTPKIYKIEEVNRGAKGAKSSQNIYIQFKNISKQLAEYKSKKMTLKAISSLENKAVLDLLKSNKNKSLQLKLSQLDFNRLLIESGDGPRHLNLKIGDKILMIELCFPHKSATLQHIENKHKAKVPYHTKIIPLLTKLSFQPANLKGGYGRMRLYQNSINRSLCE
jgi:hypothetical protein